jgi:hypothetical protein
MEPSVTTSFIPKRPIESSVATTKHSSRTIGLLSLLTFVIVVGTGVAFAGVYLYQKRLVVQKAALEKSISEARDGIGTDFVSDMNRLDQRIDGVKELIKNHIVITPIFQALEATTLRSVQYKDFSYTTKAVDATNKVPSLIVDIRGTAKNYATIALQSDAFSTNSLIKNPVFSNLTIDEKTRTVNFKLSFSVSTADLSYQTFIDSMVNKASIPNSSNTP